MGGLGFNSQLREIHEGFNQNKKGFPKHSIHRFGGFNHLEAGSKQWLGEAQIG